MTEDAFITDERVVRVRDGELGADASWVYVWVGPGGEVVYVGATSLPPAARTWLHLHHEDPSIGRVRAGHPEALDGEVVVRAFRLAPGLDRQEVKRALMRLRAGGPAQHSDADAAAAAILARLGPP